MKHIIENFQAFAGHHCITTALRHVFAHHGHDLSEEMLFGLGEGLNCFYAEFKGALYPLLGLREKIADFEEQLASHLGIAIQIHETSSPKKAYQAIKELITQNMPVMIYVDMPFLKYLNLPENAHFGGHAIVVFGLDEEAGIAYVSDRDDRTHKITLNSDEVPADFHTVTLEELEQARNSKHKPFPPKNRWLTFDFTTIKPLDRSVILPAILANANKMLNPPIKNLGVKGIRYCAERVAGWQKFDDDTLKWSAFNTFIFINQIGGTGGGGFRKMYGNFLRESGKLLAIQELTTLGDQYFAVGEEWDRAADLFYHIYETLDRKTLIRISEVIHALSTRETELMTRLKNLNGGTLL